MDPKEDIEAEIADAIILDDRIVEMLDLAEYLLTASGRKLLIGACNMHHLLCLTGLNEQSPFNDYFFSGIESDCHEFPLFDDFRRLCSPGHLERSEVRINELADHVQVELRQKCLAILAHFEPDNPDWRS